MSAAGVKTLRKTSSIVLGISALISLSALIPSYFNAAQYSIPTQVAAHLALIFGPGFFKVAFIIRQAIALDAENGNENSDRVWRYLLH